MNKKIASKAACISSSRSLLDFIRRCPTGFHTADTVKKELLENGFEELFEHEEWTLREGGKYFAVRGGSSIIAFRVPSFDYRGFMLAATHSDSPCFKIKDSAESKTPDGYVRLCTERYGGMLYSTWLDRPLSAAGRLTVRTDDGFETRLFNIDRDLLLIPNVAIHLNRDANSSDRYDPASDLLPLFGTKDAKILDIAAKNAGVDAKDIISADICVYNRQSGTVWGAENEFVSAPRLDDLQCVYSALRGFLDSDNQSSVPVLCVLDNEEVGSGTKQGADSTFLSDILTRINDAAGRTHEQYIASIANSFLVSADNAHAAHPNRSELSDKNNRPVLNGGIVIKYNANQKYTTDAVSSAAFRLICEKAGVPVQIYTNRADIPGGSTLGNISTSHVSLLSVDIGLAQLAMHSSYETAGVCDTLSMIKAMTRFFSSSLSCESGGRYRLI